ncbi:MAG: DUF1553 domain-containing protein, partial [Verrucomicrobiales bacterium]
KVTLKPGSKVEPDWPFADFIDKKTGYSLAEDPSDTRDVLAALITAPQNQRFAQVMANRLWARLMGRGIVDPVQDWEKGRVSHPELLAWLGREFTRQGYSMKNLARLILNSHAYQRATDSKLDETSPLFTSPAPRRLLAEQIVDSLFHATGKPFHTEEVSLDIDGRRSRTNSITLGHPERAWMLTSTSNERDRASLNLPRIQAVCNVLEAFGWRGARQDSNSERETSPSVIQPAVLSNGTVGIWLTRLSEDHGLTELALREHESAEAFLDTLFLKLLTRKPSSEERDLYLGYLQPGFAERIATRKLPSEPKKERRPERYVSWYNHLDAEAEKIRLQQIADARKGDPPTQRLEEDWRRRLEDVVWALLSSPEWIYTK